MTNFKIVKLPQQGPRKGELYSAGHKFTSVVSVSGRGMGKKVR